MSIYHFFWFFQYPNLITFFQFKKKSYRVRIRAHKGCLWKKNTIGFFLSCLSFLRKALLLYIHDHYWGSFLLDPIVFSLLIHLDLCFRLRTLKWLSNEPFFPSFSFLLSFVSMIPQNGISTFRGFYTFY